MEFFFSCVVKYFNFSCFFHVKLAGKNVLIWESSCAFHLDLNGLNHLDVLCLLLPLEFRSYAMFHKSIHMLQLVPFFIMIELCLGSHFKLLTFSFFILLDSDLLICVFLYVIICLDYRHLNWWEMVLYSILGDSSSTFEDSEVGELEKSPSFCLPFMLCFLLLWEKTQPFTSLLVEGLLPW